MKIYHIQSDFHYVTHYYYFMRLIVSYIFNIPYSTTQSEIEYDGHKLKQESYLYAPFHKANLH